jgi:hypothetical protein
MSMSGIHGHYDRGAVFSITAEDMRLSVLTHNIDFFCQLIGDPVFKPSGGKLGENDMDYDTDEKTMATLRRQLRRAHEQYYRRKR